MYGPIRGFQPLARWPKWIPASISSCTSVFDIVSLAFSDTGTRQVQRQTHKGASVRPSTIAGSL
jgi:hypothetical protein